jgi:GT2 family glycosyltransferase
VPPDLTISVISADNLELLLPCLRSVFLSTHTVSLEVFVVDNASADGTAGAVEAEFPQVKVIRNETRLGFSTNNNTLLGRGQGRYQMLLNDDTLLLDDALDRMVRFMDEHPGAGAAGAFLLNADHSTQLSIARFPHPLWEALWPTRNRYGKEALESVAPLEVDCVSGAAMIVRRQVIEEVGGLDTQFDPIDSEEIDWCFRINQAGWRIYAIPSARIVHYGGQTMNKIVFRKYRLLVAHKALFFRKHKGAGAAAVYRTALIFVQLGKLGWWATRGIARRGDPDRIRLHWYLLRQSFAI